MRFLEFKYEGDIITKHSKINNILDKENLHWLLESEIENAKIEIKKGTLIWHDGYFLGNWHYGIFKDGEFHGIFENGILEGGNFQGEFKSGINLIEI